MVRTTTLGANKCFKALGYGRTSFHHSQTVEQKTTKTANPSRSVGVEPGAPRDDTWAPKDARPPSHAAAAGNLLKDADGPTAVPSRNTVLGSSSLAPSRTETNGPKTDALHVTSALHLR